MSVTKITEWKIGSLATPYYGYADATNPIALTIPKYQRTFVWTTKKRRELIDSIKKGYPFGALIVRDAGKKQIIANERGEMVECALYEIIDGLQRSTTLVLHGLHPLHVIDTEVIEKTLMQSGIDVPELAETVEGLADDLIGVDGIVATVTNWARTCKTQMFFQTEENNEQARYYVDKFDEAKLTASGLRSNLAEKFEIDQADLASVFAGDLERQVEAFVIKLKKVLDVSDRKIPVIIWDGPVEAAADVFVRVNRGGQSLNKYQVLAATWASSITNYGAGEIANITKQLLYPSDGATVVKRESQGVGNLDLYELLVGLSRLLKDKYPLLFGGMKESQDVTDSDEQPNDVNVGESKSTMTFIAFNIAALVSGTRLDEMHLVPTNLAKGNHFRDGLIPGVELVNAIDKACEIVSHALYVLGYSTKSGQEVAHSEQAMASMVARYASAIFDGSSTAESLLTTARLCLPGHYILDAISGIVPSGSHGTDQAAFARVWKSFGDSDGVELNPHYVTSVDLRDFEAALDSYWIEQQRRTIDHSSKKRPRVDKVQRMLHKYIASRHAGWRVEHLADSFDMDHSMPFARILKYAISTREAYSVGSIANLALLPSKMNQSKRDRTLDEWLSEPRNVAGLGDITVEEVWGLVPYSPNQLQLPEPGTGTISAAQFDTLLSGVWKSMKTDLMAVVSP